MTSTPEVYFQDSRNILDEWVSSSFGAASVDFFIGQCCGERQVESIKLSRLMEGCEVSHSHRNSRNMIITPVDHSPRLSYTIGWNCQTARNPRDGKPCRYRLGPTSQLALAGPDTLGYLALKPSWDARSSARFVGAMTHGLTQRDPGQCLQDVCKVAVVPSSPSPASFDIRQASGPILEAALFSGLNRSSIIDK